MTDAEKLEAITALINGEFDNWQLQKIGYLFVADIENIKTILSY